METIREAITIAEPLRGPSPLPKDGPSRPAEAGSPTPERELALQIRMTASSLIGIALMERSPVPDPTRG